uniref:Uncharacterized protein n=1 Tax=Vombatus ursinus TaxID=29139 RepID=A0A4X2M7T8_VOMUR
MYRAGVWPQRHLFLPLVPFSVRMRSAGADRRGVLADKVALITGSTDGYSEILISQLYPYSRFLFQPKTTECVDRAVERLQGEGLSASGTVCHVGKEEDCKRLVSMASEKYGFINFLVCVAGVNPMSMQSVGDMAIKHSPVSFLSLSPCRVGCPEECAGVVSFLCSPDSSYIGETIVVSGFSP